MRLQKYDALIVIDVQRDFLPGGSLAVPDGDAVVPVLNRYLALFRNANLPIVATRDWHPANHCSFMDQGGPWPPHCVLDSRGAEFPDTLDLPETALVISKASEQDADAYSAFDRTNLDALLENVGVRRLFVGGLATDYCVLATVKDALNAGFEVSVLCDAIRAVGVEPQDEENALAEMRQAGANMVDLTTTEARE